ncbi:MAG: SDR family NAD(P)-dependent oxidoreductase [Candidatus Methylomirabilia bacterium]
MSARRGKQVPIAIVGVSALFPGSSDENGFWRDILAGRDLIRDVPPSHWLIEDYYDPDPAAPDKTYARRGAFLDPVPFDTLGFGVPPSIVPATDTVQLLALIVAQRVLEDAARGQFAALPRERIGVILGVTSGQELLSTMASRLQRPVWVKALREAGIPESQVVEICDRIAASYVPWQESTFPGLLGNVVAGRIANRFDLGGTNCVTDAACASTFSAVSMAVNELTLGQADLVITGGVDTLNDIFMYLCFSKTPALSRSGDCRPFSDEADGTMLGEGLAMVALKRLDDAETAGDRIYAVLRGVGSSSDGRAKSVYAPRAEGQALALRRAYAAAGYGPETVELVEAHGTGTTAGDLAEFEALRTVFEESGRPDRQWCSLGSVKSQIGHTKAAAGAAGLFKAVMALQHGALPPTIKVTRPNPKLAIGESPFCINTAARPWVRGSDHPRRASVSSFGFGGSNFHLTLEEYRGPAPTALRRRVAPSELVLFGAATTGDLARELSGLEVGGTGFLPWLARETQCGAARGSAARLAIVAADEQDLRKKIAVAVDALARTPDAAIDLPGVHVGVGSPAGGLAYLFAGQGSQYPGMGAGLALLHPGALAAWELAADLSIEGRVRLQQVVFPPPAFTDEERSNQESQLRRTQWAQPALAATALAQLNLLAAAGLRPLCLGGHSFGEVAALHAAGVFDAPTFLDVALRRGELMAAAAREPGAMTAVRAPAEQVRALLELHPEAVLANHNAPDQVVVSGPTDAVELFETRLRAEGLRFVRLPVATAFHSPLVADAAGAFEQYLASLPFSPASASVFSNAEAAPYPGDPAAMRRLLAAQLARPVRFVEQVEAMYASGARTFVELGPGSVLTGLVGKILAGRPHRAINLDARGTDAATAFHRGLARLFAAGYGMDLAPHWESFEPRPDPREIRRPASAIDICGTNYGKPYPPAGGAAALPPPNDEAAVPFAGSQPAAAAPQAEEGTWLAAYRELQRETAAAHIAWQEATTRTHLAFLQSMERSCAALAQAAGLPASDFGLPSVLGQSGSAGDESSLSGLRGPVAADLHRLRSAPPLETSPSRHPFAQHVPQEFASDRSKTAEVTRPLPPATPSSALLPAVAPVAIPGERVGNVSAMPDAAGVLALLLSVVAEKTGYPVDLLRPEMALEADLGIDSVKRVEILAALEERLPELAQLEPAALTEMRTLGDIVARLEGARCGTTAPPPAREAPPDSAPAGGEFSPPGRETPPPASCGTVDHAGLLLGVVAEKTGYPAELLTLGMELEADLGIDSIKRIEILSALEERLPGRAEVDPEAVNALRTLGDILEHLRQRASARGESPAVAAEPVPEVAGTARASTPAAETGGVRLNRFAVEVLTTASPGLGLAGLAACSTIQIVGDGGGVAEELAARLGPRALLVDAPSAEAEAVIILAALGGDCDAEAAGRAVRQVFRAARTVAGAFTRRGGVFVTVHDSGGDFGRSGGDRAWLAGIAGIAKTAAQEWPRASVKAIDLERGGRAAALLAAAILAELLEGGSELEVGLSAAGGRVTLATARCDSVEAPSVAALGERPVVLVAGGGRGVTAACMIALARRARARFVLLGSTPLLDEPPGLRESTDEASLTRALAEAARTCGEALAPARLGTQARAILAAREVRATVAALREAGSECRYESVDIRDGAALSRVLAGARAAFGPITALVHGAGRIADKLIADKTDAQFDLVHETKVGGLRALLAATAADPLRLIALFASVTGRRGNPGQCDYAAANETLVAAGAREARRRGGDCAVLALDWGPWDGGMVTPALRAHFQALGAGLIPLDAGSALFAEEALRAAPGFREILVEAVSAAVAGESQWRDLEVLVTAASHPFLIDHAIDNVPVLPVVMALEWFVRAARAARPGQELTVCRDVRVMKGARLCRYSNGGDPFTVVCREDGGGRLELELRGADGTLHYTAAAELAGTLPDGAAPCAPAGLQRFPRATYGDELFHGPQFQVIRTVEGVSREGAVALLDGARACSWRGSWATDAAVLDGGLQLALLWSAHVIGGHSLPTSVGAYHAYRGRWDAGELRCSLRGTVLGADRVVCDISFVTPGGDLVAELRRVELHRRPGLHATASAP